MSPVETPDTTRLRYIIDSGASSFTIQAFAFGLLSAFAHSPTIEVPDFQGEIQYGASGPEDASLRLVIQAASLRVTGDISKQDRQEIERRMRNEVLEANSFPEITYDCRRVSTAQKISEGQFAVTLDGELSLCGVSREQPLSARVTLKADTLRAVGELSLRQSDYEIKPVTAAGGTIRLKDELKLTFDIRAHKAA